MNNSDLLTLVNQTLDHIRTEKQLTSDEALARHLDVSNVAVYRWRHGTLPKAARILLPLVAHHASAGTILIPHHRDDGPQL
jgi:DNA-binding transcriptional regulator YiaG